MHINRGDKLDQYPFRLHLKHHEPHRGRMKAEDREEMDRRSSEDFKRMLAKGPERDEGNV